MIGKLKKIDYYKKSFKSMNNKIKNSSNSNMSRIHKKVIFLKMKKIFKILTV